MFIHRYKDVTANVEVQKNNCYCFDVNVKVKPSRYRPGVTQRVPGS
jgi:hypothetical protein